MFRMYWDRLKDNSIKILLDFRFKIQLFFFIIFNSDFFVFIKLFIYKKAMISQSYLKKFCIPGLNCYSCPSAISSCPIGSLQFWFNDIVLKLNLSEKINLAGFYIIGFISLIGVLSGRACCGFICPFGFIQDLFSKLSKKNINIPKFIRFFKYISLILFVIILPLYFIDILHLSPWFCKYLCPAGTLQAGIPLLIIDKTLRSNASTITIIKFSILIIFFILFFLTNRSFCKILCPLGAIWGLFNKITKLQLKLNIETCSKCKICEKNCPMNVKILDNQNSIECIRCGICIKKCPNKCLSF